MSFPTGRLKQLDDNATEEEKRQLMSGNGALGWAARMVRIDASYDVPILQSSVHKATVRVLKHYNTVAKVTATVNVAIHT
jgi:hypothetical protein